MKKVFLAFVLLIAGITVAWASEIVPLSQLPQSAQQFLMTHYKGVKVSYVKYENDVVSKSYDVTLANGAKVEFNGNGEWQQVEHRKKMVPSAIVPNQIKSYVATNFKGMKIVEIEKKMMHTYQIELSNGVELKFDRNFKVVKVDD